MRKANKKLLEINSTLESVSWPAIPIGAAAITTSLISQFEESQWLPVEEIEKNQIKQIKIVLHHAKKYSAFYKERLENAQINIDEINSLSDFRKIPILQRAEIQQAKETLDCTAIPKDHFPVYETKTSGSSGQPLVLKKTSLNQLMWNVNMLRDHLWHDRDFTKGLANINGKVTEVKINKNWGMPVDPIFKSGEVLNIPTTYNASQQLQELVKFQPNSIILYPNVLEQLLLVCEKEKADLSCIKHVLTIGETVSDENKQDVKRLWNAKVEDDYSSNEVGIMALQCPDADNYHIMAESVIIEILDENDNPCKVGEVGRVVVTSLHNLITPIIRYEINDLAEVGSACKCGRGLPTIKQIIGRKRNLVVKPDGTKHWPPLTYYIFESKLPITNFQLIQHSLEDVEVKLVTERKFNAEDEKLLTEKLHKALIYLFPLRFTYYEGLIPRPQSGKFEDFMCKIV